MIYIILITFHHLASIFCGQSLFLLASVSDDVFFSSCSFWFSFLLYLIRVLSSAFLSSFLQSLKLCLLQVSHFLSECFFPGSFLSMLKLLYHIVEVHNTVSQVGFNRPKLTLSMRVFGPRNSDHAFWYTYFLYGFPVDKLTFRHTYIYIYIMRNLD